MSLERAVDALRAGEFVLLHDAVGRENEVDMIMAAEFVGPSQVARMRMEAGGLICVALHPKIAENFGLPYLTEIYEEAARRFNVLMKTKPDDIPYDERSAFSLSVNHRRTFTGITDIDRALTIRELGRLGAEAMKGPVLEEFGRNFRSPGHVPILRAGDGLVEERRGHTELSVVLAELAGVIPAIAVCEMLDARTGRALPREDAAKYAEGHGMVLLSGSDILKWCGRGERG
jgi:3,4-dihydroxy 2-butanone 4-phosphate synthase